MQPGLAWISHSSTHFFLPRREETRGTPPGPALFFLCPCSGKACPQKQHALLTGEKQLSFEVLHFVKCMSSSEEKVIPGLSFLAWKKIIQISDLYSAAHVIWMPLKRPLRTMLCFILREGQLSVNDVGANHSVSGTGQMADALWRQTDLDSQCFECRQTHSVHVHILNIPHTAWGRQPTWLLLSHTTVVPHGP